MRKTSVGNRGVTIRPASAFSGREPVPDWGRVRPFPGGAASPGTSPRRRHQSVFLPLKGGMQKEPITGEGPKCVLSPEARHWKRGLLRAVPFRYSRWAKPWTIHLCLKGQLKRDVSQEMADAFFFEAQRHDRQRA